MAVTEAQRSPYAGSRPSGYKDRFKPTTTATVVNNNQDIDNRFGNGNSNLLGAASVPVSTQRIPIELLHDREVYDIYNRHPVDKQPFWIVNYQTIEAHRQPIRT